VTADFLRFFSKTVETDVGTFVGLDTPDNILKEQQRRARKVCMPNILIPGASLPDFYDTVKQKGYASKFLASFDKMATAGKGKRSEVVVCDMSQNPVKRLRGGKWLPTVTLGFDGVAIREGSDVPFFPTPQEIGFSQGWPSMAHISKKYSRCTGYPLNSLSPATQQKLQGNGMHLACVAAWHLYVFSHIIRRDIVNRLAPALPSTCKVAVADLRARERAERERGRAEREEKGEAVRTGPSSNFFFKGQVVTL
jgi:hypothetical protein